MGLPMHLTGLHLLLTYRCTYECDHCFVYSSPSAEGVMTLAFVQDAIRQAADLGTVSWIYFEGGEPFLYHPILVESAKLARELGMSVGVVTNAYWAETVEDAKVWLKSFAELGDISFSISEDEFHRSGDEESRPTQNALRAAEALGMGSGAICIEPPCELPPDKQKGEPILGGGVRFRGRAVDTLDRDDLPRNPWDFFTECPDEDWDEIGRLHLDPFGWLYPCQGVVVGNLKDDSLATVVEQYNADSHPIISPLKRGGPAELVREHKLDSLKGEYLDPCHLCYLARKKLRGMFPACIAPGCVYGE